MGKLWSWIVFCRTFVFSIAERGEAFPLAAQQPCPRGRGYNEFQSRVSLLGYLCALPIKLAHTHPLKSNVKKLKSKLQRLFWWMRLFVLKHCHPRVSPMGRFIARFWATNEGRVLWLVRWPSTATQQSLVKAEQAEGGPTSKPMGTCMRTWVLPCCRHCLGSCCGWGKVFCQNPAFPGV